jgi:hypothetical protein
LQRNAAGFDIAPELIAMLESNARRSLADETAYLLCRLFTGWYKCASRDKAPRAHMDKYAHKVLDFVASRQFDMHEQPSAGLQPSTPLCGEFRAEPGRRDDREPGQISP